MQCGKNNKEDTDFAKASLHPQTSYSSGINDTEANSVGVGEISRLPDTVNLVCWLLPPPSLAKATNGFAV